MVERSRDASPSNGFPENPTDGASNSLVFNMAALIPLSKSAPSAVADARDEVCVPPTGSWIRELIMLGLEIVSTA